MVGLYGQGIEFMMRTSKRFSNLNMFTPTHGGGGEGHQTTFFFQANAFFKQIHYV